MERLHSSSQPKRTGETTYKFACFVMPRGVDTVKLSIPSKDALHALYKSYKFRYSMRPSVLWHEGELPCILHKNVIYITTTPYLPCNNNNINRKELYDFYYMAITLTTGYKSIIVQPSKKSIYFIIIR